MNQIQVTFEKTKRSLMTLVVNSITISIVFFQSMDQYDVDSNKLCVKQLGESLNVSSEED